MTKKEIAMEVREVFSSFVITKERLNLRLP
jgi:hypothetical protein